MSELIGGLRGRAADVPRVRIARRFFSRLVRHDRGVNRSDASWSGKRTASSDRQAPALKAERFWAWYERGEALQRRGRYKDALASFDRALELKPDCAGAWHARGQTLAEVGRYFEAVASYMTALKLEPTNLFVRQDRATALAKLKRQRQTAPDGRPSSHEPRPSLTRGHPSPVGHVGGLCLREAA